METPRNSDNYDISIHALRKESDSRDARACVSQSIFQSTLSVRRATCASSSVSVCKSFQSTLSVRRATFRGMHVHRRIVYFNPRSP